MTSATGVSSKIPRARIAAGLVGADRLGVWASGTGFKMFAVLMLALLPLGILAVFGTVQAIRTTELERIAALRLDAAQGANHLLAEMNRDRATLRLITNTLEKNRHQVDICGRAQAQFKADNRPVAFAVYDRAGTVLCRSALIPQAYVDGGAAFFDQQATILPHERRLLIRVNSIDAGMRGIANYDVEQLVAMTGISARSSTYLEMSLLRGATVLELVHQGTRPSADRLDSLGAPLNLGAIDFHMATERPPVDLLRFAATLLPVFMWFAAAGVGWWVVNRFLIRPLVDLNRHVAAYQPGNMLGPLPEGSGLAREIDMLADTFREIAQDVVEHEAQLADALIQQRALTREVHHRVKNNLQIIASLINLHSRAAGSPEATAAYASIQRRVDALSVVHRNHYASAEYNQGIDAQALINELASALRASIPDNKQTLAIRVDGDNVYLSQDVAVPTAFLITELVELIMLSGHGGVAWIALRRTEEEDVAELSITSDALRPSPVFDLLLEERFGRVLTGLSRQLRATLSHDPAKGRYAIKVRAKG